MTTTTDSLLLTDDEAAAIAFIVGGAWGAPLPTVNENDEASLVPAILRGRRSLVIRGLASEEGIVEGPATDVIKRLDTGPRAMFMLIDRVGGWIPAGLTIYLYGPTLDAIEMSHLVAQGGVHHFRLSPPPKQWWALTQVAESVYTDGFTDAGEHLRPPAAALLALSRETGKRGENGLPEIATKSIRVAHRQASVHQGPITGTFSSVSQAVGWLLA